MLTLTLENRARRNSQTPSLWVAMGRIAADVPEDVRVVVLRGGGPSFSAGLDRGMLAPGGIPGEPDLVGLARDGRHDEVSELIATYQEAFGHWRRCPAVVIAAVQGAAVGAGFHLALAADLRVVTHDVSFAMPETSLGLVPDLGGLAALVACVGTARALDICATGRRIGAAEAVATGLANLAVPTNQLDATVDDLVSALLQTPEAALRAVKPLVHSAAVLGAAEQLTAERTVQAGLMSSLGRTQRPSTHPQ